MNRIKKAAIFLLVTAVLIMGAVTVLAQDEPAPPDVPQTPPGGPGGAWNNDGYTPGPRHGGMWGGGPGGGYGGMMSNFSLIDVIAQTLGLTVDEVWAELSSGRSIAELAAAYDVDVQVIIDAALAAHQIALDQAVADGWLTQEDADWMQGNMAEMLAWRVNQAWGTPRWGGGPGGPGRGPGGGFGPGGGPGGCHGGGFNQNAPVFPDTGA